MLQTLSLFSEIFVVLVKWIFSLICRLQGETLLPVPMTIQQSFHWYWLNKKLLIQRGEKKPEMGPETRLACKLSFETQKG